jgi:aryl-alcohol dehydrogenase-like predicted oxidoreductase
LSGDRLSDMDYRILGKTGLKVSTLGIGTWQLSGPLGINNKADGFPDVGEEKAINLIRTCRDFGINFIDSAEIYGNGEGERRIGKAIQGQRDQWILSTKFGLRKDKDGQVLRNAHPQTIRGSLEHSLARLQTDYLDIYLYHSSPDFNLIIEGREILEALKKEGKIRFYGISTNDPLVLRQMLENNAADVIMFSQSLLTYPSELLNLVKTYNLGGMIRGSLESGKLSGQYFRKKPQFSEQDIRKNTLQKVDFQKYAVYEKFLKNISMPIFALRYLLDFDTTHSIFLGGKTIQQYKDALRVFDIPPLEPETHEALQKVRNTLSQKTLTERVVNKIKSLKNSLLT